MHSFAVRQVVKESVHEQFDYIGKLKKCKTATKGHTGHTKHE